MAIYGAKSPLFAPFAGEEPQSGIPVYGAGRAIGRLVGCTVTPNNAEGRLDADNALAEYINEITDEDISLETDDLIVDNAVMLYGATLSGGDLEYRQGDTPPYGGYGFYHTAMRNGEKSYIGHFYPKVRATRGARTFNTKGQTITFGTSTLAMKAMFTGDGLIEVESEPFAREEDAYAWVASKLGIDDYYSVNVIIQGETAEKYTDFTGKAFVPAGEEFEIAIEGYATVTAAYDNGNDVKTSITGGSGKYAISAIDDDHTVIIIF